MRSTPSLPWLPCLLWPGVVAPDRVLSMGKIELFDILNECKQMIYAKWIELFDQLSVYKWMTDV